MMHRAAFSAILLLSPWLLAAQEVTARLDLGRREPIPYYVEHAPGDNGVVTFGPASKASTRFLAVRKYDANLKLEWSKDVIEQSTRKNVDFLAVIGQRILIFISEPMPKDDIIRNYYYSYDLQGNLVEDEATLALLPNEREQKVSLQYEFSPNQRRLLCFKSLRKGTGAETVLYYQFDESGEFVENGEIVLDYPDNRFSILDLAVTNQGNLAVLGRFNQSTNVLGGEAYQYLAYWYDTRQQRGQEYRIDLGGKFISDLAMRVDRNENIYLAGFYSNRSTDNLAGTLLQVMRPDGSLLINATYPFDADFLRNYMTANQVDRGRELRDFQLRDIVMRSDGGVVMVAEWAYTVTRSYRDIYGMWVDRTLYYYRDLVTTSVAPNGAIEWNAIVPKEQVTERPTKTFSFGVGQESLFLVFQDRPRGMRDNIYFHPISLQGQQLPPQPVVKDFRPGSAFSALNSIQITNTQMLVMLYQPRNRGFTVLKVNL